MNARQATQSEVLAIEVAYEQAEMRCDPNAEPAPPRELWRAMLDHGCLYVAEDDDGICATALTPGPNDPEVRWLTILRGEPHLVWEALGDAIGGEPHGTVHNDDLRAALLRHDRLEQTGDDPHHLTWRAHGNH